MGWIEEKMKSTQIRQIPYQAVSLGMIISSALMIWKGLICITGSESPVVVVLTGSMEPGFKRGDLLFLYMNKDPIRAGEIVVFNDGREVPIVHRVIEVHERRGTKEADILTKGDANNVDDRILYTSSQRWLQQKYIMGRAVGFLPYVGWVTIIMTEKPIIKYILLSILGLLVLKEQGLMLVTGTDTPIVVAIIGSMESGFKQGDVLFLGYSGEIIMFNVDEHQHTGEVDILIKMDRANNQGG